MPSTDPMAATVAENTIYDTLQRRDEDRQGRDPRSDARAVVDGFYATFEHEDGKRRVVLTGPWEVPPSVTTQPVFATADQG